MSKVLSIPLVGMFAQPPAKAILAVLPAGAKFTLIPDPANEYDSGAVQVWVSPTEVPEACDTELGLHLAGNGITTAEFRAGLPSSENFRKGLGWRLGFLCAKMPKGIEPGTYDTNFGICLQLLELDIDQGSCSTAEEINAARAPFYTATLGFMASGAPLVLLTWTAAKAATAPMAEARFED